MITIQAVIEVARAAIRGSTAISTFVTTTYGASAALTIFIGEDLTNPPTEDDAPFVVISPPLSPYNLGTNTEQRHPGCEIDFAVFNKALVQTVGQETYTYTGQIEADQLGMLIYTALLTAFGADYFQSANYQLIGAAPLWEGGFSVVLTYETNLGGEPSL